MIVNAAILNEAPGVAPGIPGSARKVLMGEQKTWFITGCDKGMGYVFAETLLAHGDRVVVTARDLATIEPLLRRHPDTAFGYQLDVTSAPDIAAVAAFFNMTNRVASATDMRPNPEYHAQARGRGARS